MAAFSLFNPKKVPESIVDRDNYGKEQLEVLYDHFSVYLSMGSKAVIEQEWIYLKQLLAGTFDALSTREVLEMILKDHSISILMPQFTKLANIALTIPVSTAECERGFSSVKRVKSILRNRLNPLTVGLFSTQTLIINKNHFCSYSTHTHLQIGINLEPTF